MPQTSPPDIETFRKTLALANARLRVGRVTERTSVSEKQSFPTKKLVRKDPGAGLLGSETISRSKLGWIKVILVALVFTAPFFSISFSKLTLPGIQVVTATQDLLPLYGED